MISNLNIETPQHQSKRWSKISTAVHCQCWSCLWVTCRMCRRFDDLLSSSLRRCCCKRSSALCTAIVITWIASPSFKRFANPSLVTILLLYTKIQLYFSCEANLPAYTHSTMGLTDLNGTETCPKPCKPNLLHRRLWSVLQRQTQSHAVTCDVFLSRGRFAGFWNVLYRL
jgi:hypothetical protein